MAASEKISPILDRFEQGRDSLPGAGNAWLSDLRRQALSRFAEAGIPTPKLESWKYTNLRPLTRNDFDPFAAVGDAGARLPTDSFIAGCDRLVIVNGRFDRESSAVGDLPDGVVLAPFSAEANDISDGLGTVEPPDGAALYALNTAFMRDGLVLRLPPGVRLDRPVQIVHVVAAGDVSLALHPRTLIVAGDGSAADVVETFIGVDEGAYWSNPVTEIDIGRNAAVRLYKTQRESVAAFHTAQTRVALARDARFDAVAIATGAALSRNEIRVAFNGEGAECTLTGGALLRGRQHADSTTEADHRVPHTTSRQLFKNVVDDRARSVFQGGVIVAEDAQKTDSSQSSRNLLLSAGAQADAKPELRIYADDVKCAHGATVGDLDRDAMFYLESRGIDPDAARRLLIEAFVAELLDGVAEGPVRGHLDATVAAWMQPDGEGGSR